MYSSETWDVVFTLTDSKIKEVRAICVTGFPLDQENLEKSWNNGIKPRKKKGKPNIYWLLSGTGTVQHPLNC